MAHYIPTGNEVVSLPKINKSSGGIEDLTFLYMGQKGLIELRGSSEVPLILPFYNVKTDDDTLCRARCAEPVWNRINDWLPQMCQEFDTFNTEMIILPPIEERGFIVKLSVTAKQSGFYEWGLHGCWESTWHCVNEDKQLEGSTHCYESAWNNSIVFDFRSCGPLFAFAPMTDVPCRSSFQIQNGSVYYKLSHEEYLNAGETKSATFFWGLGFEEVAAATSAKEMLRRGYDWEYRKTNNWLSCRRKTMKTEKLTALYNTNLFFCFFFSTGHTLDSEEFVCVTSRSPRYYVSAAYWDRDTLLWTFPAIFDMDQSYAKQILEYSLGRQRRNVGVHSRYIDGTVLEPGFELDELVAPILALYTYVSKSKDIEILSDHETLSAVQYILQRLDTIKCSENGLYETFLQPTDDEIVFPYLTYDNVLVWKALKCLAELYPDRFAPYRVKADELKSSILKNCIRRDISGRQYFAWSVDIDGRHDVYDEPPGSLQLLPYYGFCTSTDEVWQNTISMIRSSEYDYSFADKPIAEIGCPHAPHPWILSLCNSLLCGFSEKAWRELEQLVMDDGIACESVDENTGICTTGAAFATCAGFMCHSMKIAAEEDAKCEMI